MCVRTIDSDHVLYEPNDWFPKYILSVYLIIENSRRSLGYTRLMKKLLFQFKIFLIFTNTMHIHNVLDSEQSDSL